MKSFAANFALLLFSLLLLVAGAEVVFRLLPAPPAVRNDRPSGYYVPEGALDLRDGPYEKVKPAGTFRVAVVGDSFSFGPYLQYDDTFAKRLERMLNLNRQQPRVEVINYGLPRLSTNHEVRYVEQAIAEGADLVILQVTLNDAERKPFVPGSGLMNGRVNRGGELEFDSGLFAHWKFGAFVLQRINAWKSRNDFRDYFFKLYEHPAGWKLFEGSLAKIADRCAKAQVPLAAVIFPLLGTSLDDYPFLPLHEKIGSTLQRLHYVTFDLYPAFRGMQTERLQVLPGDDRHPNEIAHRIAADSIYEFLDRNSLVPVESRIKLRVIHRIGADISTANKEMPYTPAAVVAPPHRD